MKYLKTLVLFLVIVQLQELKGQSYAGLTLGANRAGFHYNSRYDKSGYKLDSKKFGFGFLAGITGVAKIENTPASLKLDINYSRISDFLDFTYTHRLGVHSDSARFRFNFVDLSLSADFSIVKNLGIHYFIGYQNRINFLTRTKTGGELRKITKECNTYSAGIFTGFRLLFGTKFLPDYRILTDVSYFYDFREVYYIFQLNGIVLNAGIVYTFPFKIF